MKPVFVNTIEIYCGNTACPTRQEGKTFTVIDTTDMSDAERAELLIEGADSYRWDEHESVINGKRVVERVRVQISRASQRFDGELRDGEIWVCDDCRGKTST